MGQVLLSPTSPQLPESACIHCITNNFFIVFSKVIIISITKIYFVLKFHIQ